MAPNGIYYLLTLHVFFTVKQNGKVPRNVQTTGSVGVKRMVPPSSLGVLLHFFCSSDPVWKGLLFWDTVDLVTWLDTVYGRLCEHTPHFSKTWIVFIITWIGSSSEAPVASQLQTKQRFAFFLQRRNERKHKFISHFTLGGENSHITLGSFFHTCRVVIDIWIATQGVILHV